MIAAGAMPQPRKRRRATNAGDRARKRQQNQQQRVPQPASSHEQRNLALGFAAIYIRQSTSRDCLGRLSGSDSLIRVPYLQVTIKMVRKQTDSFPVWVQGVCADQHLLHH